METVTDFFQKAHLLRAVCFQLAVVHCLWTVSVKSHQKSELLYVCKHQSPSVRENVMKENQTRENAATNAAGGKPSMNVVSHLHWPNLRLVPRNPIAFRYPKNSERYVRYLMSRYLCLFSSPFLAKCAQILKKKRKSRKWLQTEKVNDLQSESIHTNSKEAKRIAHQQKGKL